MKNIYTFLLVLLAVTFPCSELSGEGTASVSLRPSHVYIKSDTAQGAVLVTLSGYATNDVKYRLYNGGTQYNCWDNLTNTYITSFSYSKGPVVIGNPATSETFWIVYQRGTNTLAAASYRDRISPYASANTVNTIPLPIATEITDSFIISGKLLGSEANGLTKKYVVLAWNDTTLVSAGSSYLNSGDYSVYLSNGTTINKIEVRTLNNLSISEVAGTWITFTTLSDIQLVDNPIQDSKLCEISLNGADLPGFNQNISNYVVELSAGTTVIPLVEFTTNNVGASTLVTPATDLTGNAIARTTTILVTALNGTSKKTYTILFNPILEVATLKEFRNGDPGRVYIITGELLITYMNGAGGRNQKLIQDTTGGAMIDDPFGAISTSYAIGDIISGLKGKLLNVSGLIELVPGVDPGMPISSGNPVVPEVITIAQLNANIGLYESKYVKLEKVTPVAAGALIEAKQNYTISDGTNTAILRTNFSDLDYIGEFLPGLSDISGVTTSYNGTMQIIPRFITDFYVYSNIATLSALKANGTPISGFNESTLSYAITLPAETVAIPELTFTTSNDKATVEVTNATDLTGDEAARISTVVVTAEDGLAGMEYTILFTVDSKTGISKPFVSDIFAYPIPAMDQLTISGLAKVNRLDIIDINGRVLRKVKITGEEVIINISNLHKGMYFLRTESQTLKFIKEL